MTTSVVKAAVFVVDDIADDADAAPGDGICATGNGACTLRAAIDEANALAGADEIHFNISGAGPHTITASTPFALSTPIVVDGRTQPGYAGIPQIAVIAPLAAVVLTPLEVARAGVINVTADDCGVYGLSLDNFAGGACIYSKRRNAMCGLRRTTLAWIRPVCVVLGFPVLALSRGAITTKT